MLQTPYPQQLSLSTGPGNIRETTLPNLRVLLSNPDASLLSVEPCWVVAVPAKQGPALAQQLLAEKMGCLGLRYAGNNFLLLFTGAMLMESECISCFRSPCVLPLSAAMRGKAVPAQPGQGNGCQYFPWGMLKELHFKGSGRVHVAFGSTSPRFRVEAACVSSWSREATRAAPGLLARIGTHHPASPRRSPKHPQLLQSDPRRPSRTTAFHPVLASSHWCQFGHVPSPLPEPFGLGAVVSPGLCHSSLVGRCCCHIQFFFFLFLSEKTKLYKRKKIPP